MFLNQTTGKTTSEHLKEFLKIFFQFLLTGGSDGDQPETPMSDSAARRIAAYPGVTSREETRSHFGIQAPPPPGAEPHPLPLIESCVNIKLY